MFNTKHAGVTFTLIVIHPHRLIAWPPDRNGADHLPARRMQGRRG